MIYKTSQRQLKLSNMIPQKKKKKKKKKMKEENPGVNSRRVSSVAVQVVILVVLHQ